MPVLSRIPGASGTAVNHRGSSKTVEAALIAACIPNLPTPAFRENTFQMGQEELPVGKSAISREQLRPFRKSATLNAIFSSDFYWKIITPHEAYINGLE